MWVSIPQCGSWPSRLGLALALGLHGGVLYALLWLRPVTPPPSVPVTWISLAVVPQPVPEPMPQPVSEVPPVAETPLPQPTPAAAVETPKAMVARQPKSEVKPRPQPKPKPQPKTKPVVVPRQNLPVATPTPAVPPVAQTKPVALPVELAPAPVTPAQFNAAYLNNPAPAYPALARRLGEQGKVLLRAHIMADGFPETVEIYQSSGSQRLDAAARAAVARWRFVPAKQGEVALASWVVVPIHFHLER